MLLYIFVKGGDLQSFIYPIADTMNVEVNGVLYHIGQSEMNGNVDLCPITIQRVISDLHVNIDMQIMQEAPLKVNDIVSLYL